MASDRLLTSFSTTEAETITWDTLNTDNDYGLEPEFDQINTHCPVSQKTDSTFYGSDISGSWPSSIFNIPDTNKLDSEYGSDADFDHVEYCQDAAALILGPASQPDVEDNRAQNALRLPKIFTKQQSLASGSTVYYTPDDEINKPISDNPGQPTPSYYNIAQAAEIIPQKTHELDVAVKHEPEISSMEPTQGSVSIEELSANAMQQVVVPSPMDQWRSWRPLAVSDFTAPAWCELQYYISLSRYGRIRQTATMKRGTEVHTALEEEVHQYIPVDVQTKEEGWGLRIWNVIQGLRSLRYFGVTRELDVWGIIDGQVVSGIIDELSVQCPDPELQDKLDQQEISFMPTPQMTIAEFFSQHKAAKQAAQSTLTDVARIYISDTKSRTKPTLPSGSSLKPVKIQLMLYHRLLSQLANQDVPSAPIFARYKLSPAAPFSTKFTDQLSKTEFNITAAIDSRFSSPNNVNSELQKNPNLESLWTLMVSEFATTFIGTTRKAVRHDSPNISFSLSSSALSPILHASYVNQSDKSLIGGRSFIYDDDELDEWVTDELKWWRGRRPARGVGMKDAFKCKTCDFAAGCEWRKGKEREMAEANKSRIPVRSSR